MFVEQPGVDDPDRHELLLAVGEAVTNAVEHAYGDLGSGAVRVDARLAGVDELAVTVRDEGRWLSRPSDPDRGRGTNVMKAVLDDIVVTPSSSGTKVGLRKRVRLVGR